MLFQLLQRFLNLRETALINKSITALEASELSMPQIQRLLILINEYDGFFIGSSEDHSAHSPYEE